MHQTCQEVWTCHPGCAITLKIGRRVSARRHPSCCGEGFGEGGGGFIFRPCVAVAAGRLNHPCPWPLAALISGERRSRTRSISCAAANDTSPAPSGPEPRKRLRHGPSITASHCLFAAKRVAAVQWEGGRDGGGTGVEKNKEKDPTSPFYWWEWRREGAQREEEGWGKRRGVGRQEERCKVKRGEKDEEAECWGRWRRSSSLVAFIWNHILCHGTAALSLQASFVFVSPSRTCTHTRHQHLGCAHVRHVLLRSWTDRL